MESTKIKKDELRLLFDRLQDSYMIIGPKISHGVVVLSEVGLDDIPAGFMEHQGKGSYRLSDEKSPEVFSFSNGPDSFKRFLHPPENEFLSFKKSRKDISINPVVKDDKPMAFVGVRACDISALKLYDRIFLEGPARDPSYDTLRRNSVVIAVNCLYPGDNCFCSSMGTGPEVTDGADIVLSELQDAFLLEGGSPNGSEIIKVFPGEDVADRDRDEKRLRIERSRKMMKKSVNTGELPSLIYRNLEHPRWADIAKRDLECGNCTQVCPTCFCNSSYDHLHLSGLSKKSLEVRGVRVRRWDSCFSRNFARVHGGNFRPSRRARYRQWMAHKLAYTAEQFGLPGCVGCGRCITWCPVGIDITEELEALKGVR
jgi:ferredoxin